MPITRHMTAPQKGALMPRLFFIAGALAAGLAVALGAFGAHALTLSPKRLETYQTAVLYHLVHAVALCVVGWASANWPGPFVHVSGWLFAAGIMLFSGSLYLLVLTEISWMGAITPLGGVALIMGWAVLAWGVYTSDAL